MELIPKISHWLQYGSFLIIFLYSERIVFDFQFPLFLTVRNCQKSQARMNGSLLNVTPIELSSTYLMTIFNISQKRDYQLSNSVGELKDELKFCRVFKSRFLFLE